jgi:hypothetical protein
MFIGHSKMSFITAMGCNIIGAIELDPLHEEPWHASWF